MPKQFKSSLQHRAVARMLRRWRAESGPSLREVCDVVGMSTAKLSMMENGVQPIFEWDVIALANVYKVADHLREPVFQAARRARDPDAFDLLIGDARRCAGWTYGEVEAEATAVRVLALDALPHLVRTPDYAASVLEAQAVAAQQLTEPYGHDVRDGAQERLRDGLSLSLHLIITEALLCRPVGGPATMIGQLIALMELTDLRNVTVQVLPDRVSAFPGMGSPFSILSFPGEWCDDVVCTTSLHHVAWLESACAREPYEQTFAKLADVALPVGDSLGLIADVVCHLQLSDCD